MLYINKSRRVIISVLLLCTIFFVTACGNAESSTKIVLTTGFEQNEVFRLGKTSCTLPEVYIYLTNMQNQYEQVLGSALWEVKTDGVTLEEKLKDFAIARLAQIKTMTLLAEEKGVALTERDLENAKAAASEYYNSLNSAEIEAMGISEEIVRELYEEQALAESVYAYIIKDINPEISDDEARTVSVEHILIRTYYVDEKGTRQNYSVAEKDNAYKRAKEIYSRLLDGEDFAVLAATYNEDPQTTYSFMKGEMDSSFEAAAYELGTNEISDIVETQSGYHIIKCISTFDREETDANKIKIVEQRKKEVFGQVYGEFVDSLMRNLNEDLWDSVTLIHDENVATTDFFDIYQNYFSD